MDEPIRSHLPNENYRRGWDETFRRVDEADPSSIVTRQEVVPSDAVANFMFNMSHSLEQKKALDGLG